jgi:hypothetical protein
MKRNIILLVLIFIGIQSAFTQGFINLDFESANLSGYNAGLVPAGDAIPGWTAYISGISQTNVYYNAINRAGGEVEILGPGSGSAIQGSYSILIAGNESLGQVVSIGQSGTIPSTAQSLIWWGSGPDRLSFNGQILFFSVLDHETGYTIYGANISAYAGQTGELLFDSIYVPSAPPDTIDNIQFSSSPIPEPSAFLLTLFGSGILIYARRKFTH